MKIKPDILRKSDLSQAGLPSKYEFRGSKFRVPPRPNTPISLKWGPVPTLQNLVLDMDVCGKVKVVLVVLISVTKNNDIKGPYVAYADFLRKNTQTTSTSTPQTVYHNRQRLRCQKEGFEYGPH